MIRKPAAFLVLSLPLYAQIPAFPGAEGFGAYANGGRGGDVYYVTTLNNNGTGSLREGLNTAPASGRTIVFAVSGYIPVNSDTNFNVPSNVTIAGQTAPGDGVGLRGGRMLISGSNVVMRHFRIRHGRNGTGGDCLNIAGSASNTIIDHVSMMFSTDENFSFFSNAINNFTMQSSSSTWGMERHNAGGLWDLQNGSCIDSLWAHHRTRNPKARPYGLLEWINNVTFHWRSEGFIMGDSQTPANWKTNAIGNYYISIADPDDNFGIKNTAFTKARVASNNVPNFSLHLADTRFDNNDNGLVDGTDEGYGIVSGSEFTSGDAVGSNRYYKAISPFVGATGLAAVTIDNPLTAYKKVVSSVGPLRLDANYTGPLRDELDSLLKDSVVNQYSILVQKDGKVAGEDPSRPNNGEQHLADAYGITNNGFGTLNGTTPPTDSDLDGMPDLWELTLNGLNGISYNVAVAENNKAFTAGQIPTTFLPPGTPTGYTYLEEYLHFLAVPHAIVARNTSGAPSSQTIDLRKFTDGFFNSPTFGVSNVSNGSTRQFLANGSTPSANGPILKFTPTLNAIGRAGFDFTVSDAEGSQWTQRFALLISSVAAPRDLVWIGDGSSNVWDGFTANWKTSGGTSTTFDVGDTALFDDRGSSTPAINLIGTQTAGSVLVTGNRDYTIGVPGTIASTGSLTKAGDTTLTLATTTSFAAGIFLNGGTTNLNETANLNGGAIRFTGGSTLDINHGDNSYFSLNPDIQVDAGATGNIKLSKRAELNGSLSGGGTFNIFSPSNLGTEGRVYFDGASAGCTGTVNLSGGATTPGNGGRMAFRANGGGFNGFGNAKVKLTGLDLFTTNNSGGNTYALGELSGDANSRLRSNYVGGSTTWSVGSSDTSSTFAGTIVNGTASTALSKYGSGTLTLSGANTYTGDTTIYGGGLHISGSLGATDVHVGSNTMLSGTGPVGDLLTIQPNAIVSPGDTPGSAGAMTTTGGIFLNPSTLSFDLSSNPASGNDRIINAAGALTFNSTGGNLGPNFEFNLLDGHLSAGTYTLISGGSGTSAPGSPAFTHNLPGDTRQNFFLQRSGGGSSDAYVRLVVEGSTGNLTWTGSTSTWNIGSSTPWSGGPSGDNRFFNLDTVTFDNSAGNRTVTLAKAMQPAEVIVDHSGAAYTFNGGGSLSGNAILTKRGSGTLTLSNTSSHSHRGGTFIEHGSLTLGNPNAGLGNGDVHLQGGSLTLPNTATFISNSFVISADSAISSPYNGNSTVLNSTANTLTSTDFPTLGLAGVNGILSINGAMDRFAGTISFGTGGGTLRLNSNSSAASDVNFGSALAHFALGSGSARLNNRNGDKTIHLGALSGGPSTHLNGRQSGSGNTATTYRIGALNLDTCFDGTLSHGGDLDGLHLVKVGSGSLCLGGTSNLLGSLQIDSGTLSIPASLTLSEGTDVAAGATLELNGGSLTSDSIHIAAGATLTGPGTITGELTNDGFLSCTTGTLTLNGPIVNNGVARLSSGAILSATGDFINQGVLDLLTANGEIPANLENLGTVIDSSGLELTGFAISGNDVTLTLITYEGHSYRLEWSPTLTPNSWIPLGSPIPGDGTSKPFTHLGGATATKRFYRIAVLP